MNTNGSRHLAYEALARRIVFAVQDFLTFDSPIANLAINALPESGLSISSQYRQMSIVADNVIQTIGLHPSGSSLVQKSQSLELPTGAVDAVIESAFGADAGVGFAVYSSGHTETILWIDSELPISLGKVDPLVGYQRADMTIVVVFESSSTLKVVHFATDGSELNSITLDGEKYSSARVTENGIVVFGTENDQPVAAFIDEQFVAIEVELEMPVGATFASTIGLSNWNDATFYTGSAIDSEGETRIVMWNEQGSLVDQSDATDIWALSVSGAAILVDSEQGVALIVRDQALANLLDIEVDTPVIASQLAALNNRGLVNPSFTEVVQRDGEIFLSVIGTDVNGSLIHGVLLGSLAQFPSPWQNLSYAIDVNESNGISPIDALLVINRLNSPIGRMLNSNDLSALFRFDVNGSGAVTPIDALLVINHLNNSRISGEAESTSDTAALMPWTLDATEELRKSRHAR